MGRRSNLDAVANALGDTTRRAILRLVRDNEHSAGSLASEFPMMSRPAVSQHLKVLIEAGLVVARRDGRHRMFRARPEGMADMWAYLDEMWTDQLAKLKVAAERAEWAQRQRRRLDGERPPQTDASLDAVTNPTERNGR
jgi:DNA-binding transcriptional ArsR family regulator